MAHLLTPSVLGAVLINSILRKTSTENDERDAIFMTKETQKILFKLGEGRMGQLIILLSKKTEIRTHMARFMKSYRKW